jgi:hypothetical protein
VCYSASQASAIVQRERATSAVERCEPNEATNCDDVTAIITLRTRTTSGTSSSTAQRPNPLSANIRNQNQIQAHMLASRHRTRKRALNEMRRADFLTTIGAMPVPVKTLLCLGLFKSCTIAIWEFQVHLGTLWQFVVARLVPHSTLTARRATGVILLHKWGGALHHTR